MQNSDEVLNTVFTYIAQISAERSADKILSLLADLAKEIVSADRCTVWVYNEKSCLLWTKVAHGVEKIEIASDSGIVGHAIKHDREIIENRVQDSEYFNADVDKETGYSTQKMMVIPMKNYENNIIGAFQVINKVDESDFNDTDMRYIKLASTYAAETIETTLLLEEIDSNQKELIFRLSEAVELKSKETGNHIKRVAKYCRLFAQQLGLDDEVADILEFASPMHDIGKIAIADSILNKPDKLDDFEYDVMKTHTTLGYELLHSSERKFLKAAAIIAHEHHEKYDGSGYPRALKGEDIHIYGRIVAIADVFDALSMSRVYKPAWDLERIKDFFIEQKAKHFDPVLVDIFFENLDQFLLIRDTYRDDY